MHLRLHVPVQRIGLQISFVTKIWHPNISSQTGMLLQWCEIEALVEMGKSLYAALSIASVIGSGHN